MVSSYHIIPENENRRYFQQSTCYRYSTQEHGGVEALKMGQHKENGMISYKHITSLHRGSEKRKEDYCNIF